jgi:hypothetical protein
LSRRQTQQSPSLEFGAQAAPQTEHFATRGSWSDITARFACSNSFRSITGSPAGNGFRLISSDHSNTGSQYQGSVPGYAARSRRTIIAGSSAAEHREHFWPGFTFVDFPMLMTVPSTVWVQMGQ